jgi:hypothetical protein
MIKTDCQRIKTGQDLKLPPSKNMQRPKVINMPVKAWLARSKFPHKQQQSKLLRVLQATRKTEQEKKIQGTSLKVNPVTQSPTPQNCTSNNQRRFLRS